MAKVNVGSNKASAVGKNKMQKPHICSMKTSNKCKGKSKAKARAKAQAKVNSRVRAKTKADPDLKAFLTASHQEMLTTMLKLLRETPVTILQRERIFCTQKHLNQCTPSTEIEDHEAIKDWVCSWTNRIADGSASLEKLFRAVLVHIKAIDPKCRNRLVTSEPVSRNWSRAKKAAKVVIGKKQAKAPKVAVVPYELPYKVGKWKAPRGQGQYPSFANFHCKKDCTMRNSKSMRQLRQYMENFRDDALMCAMHTLFDESEDLHTKNKLLVDTWWWRSHTSWRLSAQEMTKAQCLANEWKALINNNEITDTMLIRTAIVILRPVFRRDYKKAEACSMCSKRLNKDDHPTALADVKECSHRFCKVCINRQELGMGCSICNQKRQKLVAALHRRRIKDLHDILQNYACLVPKFIDLLEHSTAHPQCPGPKVTIEWEYVPVTHNGGSMIPVPQECNEDDSEFDDVDWQNAEQVVTETSGEYKEKRVVDDTEVKYHKQRLEDLSETKMKKMHMESEIRSLLVAHPYLKQSLPFRRIHTLSVKQLKHVPQELIPEYKCKCWQQICRCNKKKASRKTVVNTTNHRDIISEDHSSSKVALVDLKVDHGNDVDCKGIIQGANRDEDALFIATPSWTAWDVIGPAPVLMEHDDGVHDEDHTFDLLLDDLDRDIRCA